MIPITFAQLKQQNPLLLANIQEGFDHYPFEILEKDACWQLNFIKKLISINGPEHSFADFYFGQLPPQRQSGLINLLPADWRREVRRYDYQPDATYLQFESADEPMTEILSFISAKEYLFSTFYFTKYPCTVWSNYNLKYPVFFKDKATKLFYTAEINRELR